MKDHPTRVTEVKQMCPGLAIETASLNNSHLGNEEHSSNRRISNNHAGMHSNKRPYSADDPEASKRMKTESRVKEE